MSEAYYKQTAEEALRSQNVSSGGLAPQEAAQRLERFGPNKLSEGKKKSVAAVFAE